MGAGSGHGATVVVSGWSDSIGAPPFPQWRKRPQASVVTWSSLPIELRQFPPAPRGSVNRHRKAAQKHRCSSDVLASPSELWGIVSSIQDVALDLTGTTLGAAHQVMHVWRSVLRRACQRRWQLALLPLSQLFTVLLCMSEGLRMRV